MPRPVLSLIWISLLAASCVDPTTPLDDPTLDRSLDTASDPDGATAPVSDVCTTGENRCDAIVRMSPSGAIRAFAAPRGLGPADLTSAYSIPAPKGIPTIAIVDAFGYAALETDLAMYRTQYGLAPCTRANGCLAIVNEAGQPTPLPAEPPPTDDWTVETALDVQMASAVCPACRILVVQATDSGASLYRSQNAAAALGATVISNSWGGPENAAKIALEPSFDHPGIAIFVSAGDKGYNEGGAGPHYPSASSHVISVGGTRLVRDASSRGWSETAWSLNKGAAAGSSCSAMVAKPAYQASVPCAFKAATDISAVADPATGVAVYNARNGGWIVLGGTSAAAPIVASIFAIAGHGADASGPYIAQHTAKLYDVKAGTNGACATSLCNSGVGWDGPTGYGTPNATLLAGGDAPGLSILAPIDGSHVTAGFKIVFDATNATSVELAIDGIAAASTAQAPFVFSAPDGLASGSHAIELTAKAITGATRRASVTVVLDPPKASGGGSGSAGGGSSSGSGDDGAGHDGGGCASAGGSGSAWLGLALVLGIARRRRRRSAARVGNMRNHVKQVRDLAAVLVLAASGCAGKIGDASQLPPDSGSGDAASTGADAGTDDPHAVVRIAAQPQTAGCYGSPTAEGVENLVDGDPRTKFLAFANSAWMRLDAGRPFVLDHYAITSANDFPERDPRSWIFQGSNDGVNWTDLDIRTGETFTDRHQRREFAVATEHFFRHYRLRAENRETSTIQLAELEIFGRTPFTGSAAALPASPAELSATPVSRSAITLVWTDGGGQPRLYRIEQSADGAPFTPVAYTAAGTTSVTIARLPAGATRRFRVIAENAAGESAPSSAISAMTKASLVGTKNADGTVRYAEGGYTLTIDDKDPANTPDNLVTDMIDEFFAIYPQMAAAYNPATPKSVRVTFDPTYDGIAATNAAAASVIIASAWAKQAGTPDGVDVIAHEGFHVVQAYSAAGLPGWAVEGLADYARLRFGQSDGRACWTVQRYQTGQSYTDAYGVTARFLLWLEDHVKPGITVNLNTAMRGGTYSAAFWTNQTGKTVDALWTDYAAVPAHEAVRYR